MCLRLCSRAEGITRSVPDMKTAVPGTRCGGDAWISRRKSLQGQGLFLRRPYRTWRPRFQVDIRVNTTAATLSGKPAAVGDFGQVGAEERQIEEQKSPA